MRIHIRRQNPFLSSLPCLLSGWLVFVCLATTPQAQYRFDHWSADNGLPQNSVREIIQTRDGYLWLTTMDGLVRFDGVRFTVFNKRNSPGLTTNRFSLLYEDGQGDLWVSTENDGVVRLHQGRFTTYTTEHGLPQNRIFSLGNDGYGGLVVFPSFHLYRWDEGRFHAADDLNLPFQPANARLKSRSQRTAFFSDDKTELKAVANGHLYTWRIQDLAPDFLVASSTVDQDGTLWFGSFKHGLLGFEQGQLTKRITQAEGLPGIESRLIYGPQPLQAFSIGADRSYWLFDLTSRKSELLTRTPPEKATLCYGDREGNYWFTTYNDGLYRYQRQSITAINEAQGLKTDEIYPLLEDRQGAVWIGTALDGLYLWQQGQLKHFEPSASGFPISISSLYEDRAGRIWVNGAWRLDGERFVRIYDELPGQVWTMYEDEQGAFWRGTAQGVDRYQNGSKTHFTTQNGLAGNDTKVILSDGKGGCWLGSYGGLTHYQDGKFTKWKEQDGLPGSTVRMLRQDADGALWIGTYDSGLGRFKDGKFTRYSINDGLTDNGVFQMLEDEQGWCWMSCNRGLYRIRKQELNDFADGKIKHLNAIPYGKSDGMSNVECNGGRWPAGIKTREGKLWFPTMDGIAVVNPASVSNNQQPPPVKIEGMRIDYQAVKAETWYDAVHQPEGAIYIQPGQENFELDYTALSFISSEQLKFRYKMEGLDQDWVEAGTRRTANFSHVPPGSYTFTVIAANRDGVWNTEGQSVKIIVQPRFYRTWWFLSVSVLSVAGFLWIGLGYRVRQLKRERALQQEFSRQLIESQEAERKRIAAGLHDSLGQQLLVIKNWAMIGLSLVNGNHQTRETLDEISTTASQAIEEVREVIYDLRPYQLDKIGLANTIRYMIEKVAAASGIDFRTTVGDIDDLFTLNEQVTFYRVIQECVNNIVKHSQATVAHVRIERHEQTLDIMIEDNGRGFVLSQLASAQPSTGGLGLTSLRERVRILGGRQTIDSVLGGGTKIHITIDLKHSS